MLAYVSYLFDVGFIYEHVIGLIKLNMIMAIYDAILYEVVYCLWVLVGFTWSGEVMGIHLIIALVILVMCYG